MIYTAITERMGSFANKFVMAVDRYDAYRGHFGYKGDPIIYYTNNGLQFCILLYSDVRLTGAFEDHEARLIQPALNEVLISSLHGRETV